MAEVNLVKRSILWLRRTLRITEKTTLPGEISGQIRPTLDALGWELVQETEHVAVNVLGPGSSLTLFPVVPANEAHLYFAATGHHSDGGGSHSLMLNILSAASLVTGLIPTTSVASLDTVAIQRPILIPAGATLRLTSQDAIPALTSFFLTGEFIRLNAGEYVPGSPYG